MDQTTPKLRPKLKIRPLSFKPKLAERAESPENPDPSESASVSDLKLVHIDLPVPTDQHGPAWVKMGRLPEHLQVDKSLFQELCDLHPEELGKIKMFGKEIDTPRYQANYGQEYFYTGILHPANPISHPYLKRLMEWVCAHSGKEYKQMIINWYMDGNHYIGPHADSEKGIVPNSDIYSITLGPRCTRKFLIHSKQTNKIVHEIPLSHGDLLIMGGSMQKYYKHSVPKTKLTVGPRINITFRLMR